MKAENRKEHCAASAAGQSGSQGDAQKHRTRKGTRRAAGASWLSAKAARHDAITVTIVLQPGKKVKPFAADPQIFTGDPPKKFFRGRAPDFYRRTFCFTGKPSILRVNLLFYRRTKIFLADDLKRFVDDFEKLSRLIFKGL